jgi:hypothetical protein
MILMGPQSPLPSDTLWLEKYGGSAKNKEEGMTQQRTLRIVLEIPVPSV